MSADWQQYQEDAAQVFRDLGFDATTDVTLHGARYRHDVDVVATYRRAGLELTWIIECKRWRSRVGKDRVLTLRGVVEDVGAEKGILVAENGFQAGALAMTEKSNVHATSLATLRTFAADALVERRLAALPQRIAHATNRYWAMPKSFREATGLRPDGPVPGYSAAAILRFLPELMMSGFAGVFPPHLLLGPALPLHSKDQVASDVEVLLEDTEARLDAAEAAASPDVHEAIAGHARSSAGPSTPVHRDAVAVAVALAILLRTDANDVAARLNLRMAPLPDGFPFPARTTGSLDAS